MNFKFYVKVQVRKCTNLKCVVKNVLAGNLEEESFKYLIITRIDTFQQKVCLGLVTLYRVTHNNMGGAKAVAFTLRSYN